MCYGDDEDFGYEEAFECECDACDALGGYSHGDEEADNGDEEGQTRKEAWRAAVANGDTEASFADWQDSECETRYEGGNPTFADPGGNSALRASSRTNPRNLPCPTCGEPDRLTPLDRRKGYQCDSCADRAEGYGD